MITSNNFILIKLELNYHVSIYIYIYFLISIKTYLKNLRIDYK